MSREKFLPSDICIAINSATEYLGLPPGVLAPIDTERYPWLTNYYAIPESFAGYVLAPQIPFIRYNGQYSAAPFLNSEWPLFVSHLTTLSSPHTKWAHLDPSQKEAAVRALAGAMKLNDQYRLGAIIMPWNFGFEAGVTVPNQKQTERTAVLLPEWMPPPEGVAIKIVNGARMLPVRFWMVNPQTGKKYEHQVIMDIDHLNRLA